jgi:predicted hydrolase (HD superfamily)
MNRDDALALVHQHVTNRNLVKHMLAVEACMIAYAKKLGGDSVQWGMAGLLHDTDWEKYPDDHPQVLLSILREKNADAALIHAINAHGGKDPIQRETMMDKALFACDEMVGFVTACALIRPDKLSSLTAESVMKKMKEKGFAKAVNRHDLELGAKELGLPIQAHITNVIEVMKSVRKELGL